VAHLYRREKNENNYIEVVKFFIISTTKLITKDIRNYKKKTENKELE
jgi:hypothetical protein